METPEPAPPVSDDPNQFRAPWCAGPGQDPGARLTLMLSVARDYDSARAGDCRTEGLLPELSEQQLERWLNYLIGYSTALAGCPRLPVSVPGGILVFGPANTNAIDLPRPALGRAEASLLIGHFLDSFAAQLELTDSERQVVEAQLWSTADSLLDGAASGALSRCGEEAP